jgi:outer membrane protein assembly factor BamD
VSTENRQIFTAAINNGKPVTADVPTPTGPNEPPRTDQPSNAPLQLSAPAGGTGVGAEIVSAPASDPNALVKSVQPTNSVLPAPDKPAEAPLQTNEIKPGTTPTAPTVAQGTKAKKPKADLSEESSSKKKKKKGIGKLNPF